MNLKKIEPRPYPEEEREYTDYLVKKYSFRLEIKDEKYRVYK